MNAWDRHIRSMHPLPPMTTADRAQALASAAAHFPLLGEITAEGLLETVRLELGHAEILDGFRPYGAHFSKAFPRGPLLHVLSGNTPHAGLQSLIRGLLLGAKNRMKLPSAGLPEIGRFVQLLPEALRDLAELRTDLPDEWMRGAQAVIVFGSDETVAHFRRRTPGGAVFESHPHRISLGVIFADAGGASAALAAADAAAFNQKGCLSPHDFYVAGDARGYAGRLAAAMADYERGDPRGPVTVAEAAEIANMRANYRFRAASDPRVQLWESPGSSAWTVIYEEDPWFAASCLNRVIFVKPLPDDLPSALGPAADTVAGVGIWPAAPEHAEAAAALRPSRICPLGRMQLPPVTWHQEGRQNLAPLTRWVDFEPNLV